MRSAIAVESLGTSWMPSPPANRRLKPRIDRTLVSRLELLDVEGDRPSPDAPAPGGAGGAPGLGEARNELAKVHGYTVDEGEILVIQVV
jgi:hypothetical protein